MNIARSFATYMEDEGYGVFGTDLFVGGAPKEGPDVCYWVVLNGGAPESRNETGEVIKQYSLSVYYRSTSEEDVYDTIQALEIELNKAKCVQLDGFDTIEIQCILFPADQDIDNEDRTVVLLEVQVRTYYKE